MIDVFILGSLPSGPRHGCAIKQQVADASGDLHRMTNSQLYPALARLQAMGAILRGGATGAPARQTFW